MGNIQVANINIESADHIAYLNPLRITKTLPISPLSLPKDRSNFDSSLRDLLSEVGFDIENNSLVSMDNFDAAIPERGIGLTSGEENPMAEYFFSLLSLAWEASQLKPNCRTLVVNLLNLELPGGTVVNQLARAYELFEEEYSINDIRLVFLSRNTKAFSKSKKFLKLTTASDSLKHAVVIGLDGCYHTFKSGEGLIGDPLLPAEIKGRSLYQGLLELRPEHLTRTLVYQTNINIGHFALRNSHVRTHYNLSDVVTRPNLLEAIHSKLASLSALETDPDKRVKILALGLEKGALSDIGNKLSNFYINLNFEVIGDYHIDAERIHSWFDEYSSVIILTDVVNTGNSLVNTLSAIRDTDSNFIKILNVFSLVVMKNTEDEDTRPLADFNLELNYLVKIDRVFYALDDCMLCKLGQPKVEDVESVEDFTTVLNTSLTPLDFWELVSDSNALVPSEGFPSYRVSTERILNKYYLWIKRVVSARLKEENISALTFDKIITIDETGGIGFAELISDTLRLDPLKYIDALPRDSLGSDLNKTAVAHNGDIQGKKILIVDDGINTGNTILKMIEYVKYHDGLIVSIIVFDERLDESRKGSILTSAGCGDVISLYSWPIYKSLS